MEKQLHSTLTLSRKSESKEVTSLQLEKVHFSCLYPQSFFNHYPKLMTTGKGKDVDQESVQD